MPIRIETKRKAFCEELTEAREKEYFNIKDKKFIQAIDNIYYNVYLEGDHNDNPYMSRLLSILEYSKEQTRKKQEPQPYDDNLNIMPYGIRNFSYVLRSPDLYDICITPKLPTEDNPRIHVQLQAMGLWTRGVEEMMLESYEALRELIKPHDITIKKILENRIDMCYHTNAVQNMKKEFFDHKLEKYMKTNLSWLRKEIELKSKAGKSELKPTYLLIGSPKSNNLAARIYDKTIEVIEMGYKGYFIELWYKEGIINYYDKYCLSRAYKEKNYNSIHKARLEFYIEHNPQGKQVELFKEVLRKVRLEPSDVEEVADKYMPKVTTVINIEWQTMRKFYKSMDNFIDTQLKTEEREGMPANLERVFKITDNRRSILDYLSRETLYFERSWWKRLQSTKVEGIKVKHQILREYNRELDISMSQMKFVNSLVTHSVYKDSLETGIKEDYEAMMISLESDNSKYLLEGYNRKKERKEHQVKNRKAR